MIDQNCENGISTSVRMQSKYLECMIKNAGGNMKLAGTL